MFEFLLFICSLAIIIPGLLAASILYNINRQIQGKPAVTTEQAIKESFRLSLQKARQLIKYLKKKLNMRIEERKHTKKNKIDDAEFRDA